MDLRDLTYTYYLRRKNQKSLPQELLGSNVLELGAGLDNYSVLFDYENYTAVDLDTSLKEHGFRFLCQDINDLQLGDEEYDYFIASNVLEHIKSPAKVLARLHAFCSHGGYIVVPVNGDFPFLYDPINWIRKRVSLPVCNFGIGGFGHVSLLTETEWEAIFKQQGFVITGKQRYTMDIWACLEFFIFSIFLSKHEYVSICTERVAAPQSLIFETMLKFVAAIQRPFFWLLQKAAWNMNGHIGVEYTLAKTSRSKQIR